MLCERCGYEDTTGLLEKRVDRGASKLCSSCRARPATTVKTEFGECLPWSGDFDTNDNPLNKDGSLYLPGLRKCGNSDCVQLDHVLTFLNLETERHDISYRTGKKLSVKEFLAKLRREAK
jgi:hypothetical protein